MMVNGALTTAAGRYVFMDADRCVPSIFLWGLRPSTPLYKCREMGREGREISKVKLPLHFIENVW